MSSPRMSFMFFFVSFFCINAFCADANPLRNLELGGAAFPFSLPDARGNIVALEKYKGKPVVVCYWRRGQSFSVKMLEALARAHARFGARGVEFVSIVGKEEEGVPGGVPDKPELSVSTAAGRDTPAQTLPFPVLLDDKMEVYGSYGLFILPTTFVLDREHRLAAYFSSYYEGIDPELDSVLYKILGIKEPPKEAPRFGTAPGGETPGLNLARKLLEDGKAEEALPMLEEELKKSTGPASAELKLLSGQALFQLGRFEEAAARLEDCLKADPSSHQGMLLLGRTLTLLGRYEPAEELLKKNLALNPYPEKAHYYLGELYEKTGRKDLALAEYRLALEGVFRR